jgi:hypothetical protein
MRTIPKMDLSFFDLLEAFAPGHFFGAVKSLPAFSAAVRAIRQDKQHPEFQQAPAFGAVHVVAPTQRAVALLCVDEQT